MTQTATIITRTGSIQVELPAADSEVVDGVRWGSVDAFPSPAYWHYQVLSRRLYGSPAAYKLGRTLAEELGACLLGGHGIPASVGLAAYERLRACGAFESHLSQDLLELKLREPLMVNGRPIRYRFAAQKAKYLAAALPAVQRAPEATSGKALRDWLTRLPGVGLKTASWVARNWMDADDVAILDIHIMRVGQAMGLFPRNLTVERDYQTLEARFIAFSQAIDVRASELDAVVWYEMASSPSTARFLTDVLSVSAATSASRRAEKESTPVQLRLAA